MLVGGVLLVAPTRITVKGEKCLFRIVNGQTVFLDVFNDAGAAEIPGNADIDSDIDDVIYSGWTPGMLCQNFLDDCLAHIQPLQEDTSAFRYPDTAQRAAIYPTLELFVRRRRIYDC